MTSKENDNNNRKFSNKQFVLSVLLLGSIMIAIATYLIDDFFRDNGLPYPENLHTLIIEVGIGVIITLLIYTFSTQQQNRLTRLVSEIKKIEETQQKTIQEQEEFKQNRREFAIHSIRSYLADIDAMVHAIEHFKSELRHNPNDENKKELLEFDIDFLKRDLKNISLYLGFSSDILEPHHLENVRHIMEITEQYLRFPIDFDANPSVKGIIANITTTLNELPNPPV